MRAIAVPVAAALLALSACGSTPSAAPDPTASVTTAPGATFGPEGYDGVRLGMRGAEVRAAGVVVRARGGCADLVLPGVAAGVGGGLLSSTVGVALITTTERHVVTPEGIHVGSTLAQVQAAYPHLHRAPDFWAVGVPGHPGTSYWLGFRHGRLGGLTLVLDRQNCVS